MFDRRKFLKCSALSASLLAIDKSGVAAVLPSGKFEASAVATKPIVISTWILALLRTMMPGRFYLLAAVRLML